MRSAASYPCGRMGEEARRLQSHRTCFLMAASSSVVPVDFSFLSPSSRPTPEEVRTYAELIKEVEHRPPEYLASCLHEAELQLWIWRNESRKRAPRRRRRARPSQTDIVAPQDFTDSAA